MVAIAELDARLGRRALNREVAAALDVSLSYASCLRVDPTGELDRERKRTLYGGKCEECGGPTDGSNGPGKAPKVCLGCLTSDVPPKRPRVRPYRPLKVWDREKCVDAVVTFALERGVLPRVIDVQKAEPGKWPCAGTFYRYFRGPPLPTFDEPWAIDLTGAQHRTRREAWEDWARRRAENPPGPFGAIVEAVRQDRIPPALILGEPNSFRRQSLTEAYGLERLVRHGELIAQDDFGRLWRLDLGLPEPLVMVEVLNSTPEPDGTFKDYWLRVPPAMTTAREAVAWTFDVPADEFMPVVET